MELSVHRLSETNPLEPATSADAFRQGLRLGQNKAAVQSQFAMSARDVPFGASLDLYRRRIIRRAFGAGASIR